MTAVDPSGISASRTLEALQRPDAPNVDARDQDASDVDNSLGSSAQDIVGMTDCLPSDGKENDIFLPRDDREPFIDDQGRVGWRTFVDGTSGDDTISVIYNQDGSADVTINGETTHYSAEDAKNMRISGGAGNDTITVQDNREVLIFGDSGSVTVEGGSGDDNISGDLDGVTVDGGTGRDTINGLDDQDWLSPPIEPGFPEPCDPGFVTPMLEGQVAEETVYSPV